MKVQGPASPSKTTSNRVLNQPRPEPGHASSGRRLALPRHRRCCQRSRPIPGATTLHLNLRTVKSVPRGMVLASSTLPTAVHALTRIHQQDGAIEEPSLAQIPLRHRLRNQQIRWNQERPWLSQVPSQHRRWSHPIAQAALWALDHASVTIKGNGRVSASCRLHSNVTVELNVVVHHCCRLHQLEYYRRIAKTVTLASGRVLPTTQAPDVFASNWPQALMENAILALRRVVRHS